ncbi:MAG: ATP--guanido phosphotransferase, partial [Megasphaera sp.]|nr:ATP--guanido phosphotransferase [Megasphaera sp.]
MVLDMLMAPLCPWQDGTGEFCDIVLDSRVRLNRNLKKYVFPDKASDTELSAVLDEAKGQLGTLNTLGQGHYRFISFEDLTPLEREVLAVKHLSSAGHIERPQHRGILLR